MKNQDDQIELRQRAEELAHENASRTPEQIEALSPEEIRRMLHELRVHQIELTMQNEELRRAQVELDAARERYFDLYNLTPVGYCTISEGGLILEANLTAATLLGVARGKLITQPFSQFVFEEDQDIYYRYLRQLFKTGEPQACTLRLVKSSGATFWAQLEANATQDAAGAAVGLVVLSDITERKQAEDALRASENLLREIAANYPHSYLSIIEKDFTIGFTAGQEFKKQGLDPNNFIGLTLEQVFGKHASCVREHYLTAFGGVETEFELFINNQHQWYRIVPLQGPDGRINRILSVVENITERKQAEAALREKEAEYRALVQNISTGIVVHDAESAIVFTNARASFSLGLTEDQLRGKTAMDPAWRFLREDETEMPLAEYPVNRVRASGEKLVDYMVGIRRSDRAEPSWALCNAYPVDGADGRLAQVVVAIADITALKQAEQALAAEKERLAVTLHSIGDGVLTTDVKGNLVSMNKAAEELTGWMEAEAAGYPLDSVLCIINELTRQPAENPATQVLASGQIIEVAEHTLLISRDGTERLIGDIAAPIRDRHSEIIGVVLVIRDMTEKRKIQEYVQRTAKLESVGVLAGGIAHDFNNLLTGLFGNIELAKMFLPDNHKSYRFLETAGQSMESAASLTKQLLTFAKGGDPVKETLAIGKLIREAAQFSMRGSHVTLDSQIPPDLWWVEADKGQLDQVISNLVINAQQAMPDGGTITLAAANVETAGGRHVKITVQDEGVGIAPQHLNKIFDPYFSTKQKGRGLGLASTHSIIHKHNGTITVASNLNQGTTFTIHLPAAIAPDKMSAANQPGHGQPAPGFAAHILVMDDEEVIRELVGVMLEELGHTVGYAAHGQEAVEKYRQARQNNSPFDLVIVDLTVPGGMGGQATAQEILKLDPQARIIVSSGYATDSVMANYKAYGFKARVAKPYFLTDLQKTIEQVLKS